MNSGKTYHQQETTADPQLVQRLVDDELCDMQPEVVSAHYPFAELVAKYGEVMAAGDACKNLAECLCRSMRQRLAHRLGIDEAKLPLEIASKLPDLAIDLAVILLTQAFSDSGSKPESGDASVKAHAPYLS